MVSKSGRVTESDVAFATLRVAANNTDGIATFYRLKKELPNYLRLSAEDLAQSPTRPNEPLWEQIIRNIKSHSTTPGNIICEGYAKHIPHVGYQITDSGRSSLKGKGY